MDDEKRILALVSYLFPIVGGILIFLLRKGRYERFHAVQSIFFWLAVIAISIGLRILEGIIKLIPVIKGIFGVLIDVASLLFGLVVLALWIVLMWKAFRPEKWKLPLLGALAEKVATKY